MLCPISTSSRQRYRPGIHQRFQHLGKLAAVDGNMTPGVVMQVDGRVSQVTREGGAVIVSLPIPLQIVHAQAMQEHDNPFAQGWRGLGQRSRLHRQRPPVTAQAHANRQRVPGRFEVVAQHAVQRCEQCLAPRPCAFLAELWNEPGEQAIQCVADDADNAANAAVDQPGDAGGASPSPLRRTGYSRDTGDVDVHRFHQVDHPRNGVDGEPAYAMQVGR